MNKFKKLLLFVVCFFGTYQLYSQESIPRLWINELLNAIRNDRARPPVHARNLHHLSLGMFDAWAVYQPNQNTIFLGKNYKGFTCPFYGQFPLQDEEQRINYQEMAISYFAYRLIRHRFASSPGAFITFQSIDTLMTELEFDPSFYSVDYLNDGPAALGNYLAQQLIQYGFQDNSNETNDYSYQFYEPANSPIEPELPGNPSMTDPNRWQAVSLTNAVDQSGNPVAGVPPFVAPEWGNVNTFALTDEDAIELSRDGDLYKIYHIPESPPYLDTTLQTELEDFFKWNFLMVSVWQSHLDPSDNVVWDISPASIGNLQNYPTNWDEFPDFYNFSEGGDAGIGYSENPITGVPYEPQFVNRADYARVLAEFWADGIDSETPPGHWFEIYNEVSEHPLFEWKWKGQGETIPHMDYDIRAYLTLGGAMHDAAVAAWSVKGWYDYPRPISTIRFMADLGQSSNPMGPNFHPGGLPLIEGYVEQVTENDPLAGAGGENIGKIKLYTWKGHEFVFDPATDVSGVGWILAENWWPYQRPNFVTPPFAGYVSGHSTFSRAAAEVLTFITGSAFFPGGMSSFVAEQNNFLEFELGPSQEVILQWATYRDASDQCALSRIWGGIHPPIDDIPGRKIGEEIGYEVTSFSDSLISMSNPSLTVQASLDTINSLNLGGQLILQFDFSEPMDTSIFPVVSFPNSQIEGNGLEFYSSEWLNNLNFIVTFDIGSLQVMYENVMISLKDCWTESGFETTPYLIPPIFLFDTEPPQVLSSSSSIINVNSNLVNDPIIIDWYFSENCNTQEPVFTILTTGENEINATLDLSNTQWVTPNHLQSALLIENGMDNIAQITVTLEEVFDQLGNPLVTGELNTTFIDVNAQFPELLSATTSSSLINGYNQGSNIFFVELQFSKVMDTSQLPQVEFVSGSEVFEPFIMGSTSNWMNDSLLLLSFGNFTSESYNNVEFEIRLSEVSDIFGNVIDELNTDLVITFDNVRPAVVNVLPSAFYIDYNYELQNDFYLDVFYSEQMFSGTFPWIDVMLNGESYDGFSYDPFSSFWVDNQHFRARFLIDWNLSNEVALDFLINSGMDILYNPQIPKEFIELVQFNGQNLASISEASLDEWVKIYPNPLSSSSTLNFQTECYDGFKLTITDIYGREIERLEYSKPSGIYNFTHYESGEYLLLFNSGENIFRKKLILYE